MRQAADRDEVDDVTAEDPGAPHETVDEVADGATEDEAEGHGPRPRGEPLGDPHDDDGHGDRDDGEDPRLPGREGEGGARVAHQDQAKRPAEQRRVPTVGQG